MTLTDRFSRNSAAILGALALSLSAMAAPAEYQLDSAHSSAQFSVRHMMISTVKGEFTKLSGTVVYDPSNLAASKIDAVIDATTVNTREVKRDAHLKSPDFFDTAKFPTLAFKSTEFRRNNGKLQVKGNLTMRGVTREVVLDVDGPTSEIKDPWGNARFGATASAKINRKDWGLTWNQALEAGAMLVGEEVTITLDIEAVRPLPAAKTSAANLQ
jgi:polyisoprenoid-binding protein YceI